MAQSLSLFVSFILEIVCRTLSPSLTQSELLILIHPYFSACFTSAESSLHVLFPSLKPYTFAPLLLTMVNSKQPSSAGAVFIELMQIAIFTVEFGLNHVITSLLAITKANFSKE